MENGTRNVAVMGAMDPVFGWGPQFLMAHVRKPLVVLPDLRLHLERYSAECRCMGLVVPYDVDRLEALCREVLRFPADAELYIFASHFMGATVY